MTTSYARRLADTALGQCDKYHFFSEDDPPLANQISKYWNDLDMHFPGVGTAWSAVFVSWCAKKAGAVVAEFPFSARHATYIQAFIRNAVQEAGLFRAFPLDVYGPAVGDLIQNNRGGNNYDYEFARTHAAYESHTAIVVETGEDSLGRYAMTVGGNESDSVRRKVVRLSASGKVRQRPTNPYICVVQCLK
ncbi:MAG TPA: DUF2272 domain-containing protein [Bauldia sp.]|nr:DUF2272 domain-containing protein [Bauldia sp.]